MTALDTLARSASDAVHESVAQVPIPVAPGGIVAGTASSGWGMLRYGIAGAAAGLAVLAVLVFSPAQEDTPSDTTVPTTVAPTITVSETDPTTPPTTEAPVPDDAVAPPVVIGDEPSSEPPPPAEDVEPPFIEVLSPANGDRLETKVVTFTGRTEPGASVLASGKFAVDVGDEGSWTVDLILAPGANGVVFTATDEAGNQSEARMTVYYDAPEAEEPKETTTTTKAVTWEFSATQKYGNCSEPIPYDEFSGTAKPGSKVTISSAYGSGSTTADGDGKWWIKVEFPSAPYNKVFTVKATDEFGTKKTFEFVSLYQA